LKKKFEGLIKKDFSANNVAVLMGARTQQMPRNMDLG